jgi:hypothetical protein
MPVAGPYFTRLDISLVKTLNAFNNINLFVDRGATAAYRDTTTTNGRTRAVGAVRDADQFLKGAAGANARRAIATD